MARQNVGNPKFYIDYLSYWKARANILEYNNTNGHTNELNKLIGLNPSDYLNLEFTYPHTIKIDLKHKHNYVPKEVDDEFFIGAFGHNFFNILNKNFGMYLRETNTDAIVFSTETDVVLEEICNFPTTANSNFEYNSWSLAKWTGGIESHFEEINFTIDSSSANADNQTILGNLVFGHIFQMPHSPDLQLTMTREYDGVKTQQTKGGNTLTQIDYYKASDWAGYPAWELFKDNAINLINDNFVEARTPARGRRIWDLKFSYIDHKNMFPINELVINKNPTDSDTNSNSGYDSTDFDSLGNFNSEIRVDNSFMGVVMEKTLGGALPFIFQPDGNNNSPDQFAICQIDQGSFQFKQVAHNVYDISLKIREVW